MYEKLYHTVDDRSNPKEIENNGPFKCERRNAWLGEGYYFWDDSIGNAHWWGNQVYNGSYVICYVESNYKKEDCCDLTDISQLKDFKRIIELCREKKMLKEDSTIPTAIHTLRTLGLFPYKIIKIKSERTKKYDPNSALKFNHQKPQYLDFDPPIQLCFEDKLSINMKVFKIIYPTKYVDGYLV